MKTDLVHDVRNKILNILSLKDPQPDTLYGIIGSSAADMINSLHTIVLYPEEIREGVKTEHFKNLLMVQTSDPKGDSAFQNESLLREMIATILFKKDANRFFVKKEEMQKAGYRQGPEIGAALAHINKLFNPVLMIDFSEDQNFKDHMYFFFRNNLNIKIPAESARMAS